MHNLSDDDATKLVTEEPIDLKSFPSGGFSEDDDGGLEADPALWAAGSYDLNGESKDHVASDDIAVQSEI